MVESRKSIVDKLNTSNQKIAIPVILEKISGSECEDHSWLIDVGILTSDQTFIKSQIVTEEFIHNKAFGKGWVRGGGESFYKIVKIEYFDSEEKKSKYIAFKAINSMGDIESKALQEASWMYLLSRFDICGKVYAVGDGTIVKDFLIEDDYEISREEEDKQRKRIFDILGQFGLKQQHKRPLEIIQTHGKLMLIDLGSGDISGPSYADLITR